MIRNILSKMMVVQNVQPLRKVSKAVPKEKWDIFSGILIERLPIISKSLNNIETEYMVSLENVMESFEHDYY